MKKKSLLFIAMLFVFSANVTYVLGAADSGLTQLTVKPIVVIEGYEIIEGSAGINEQFTMSITFANKTEGTTAVNVLANYNAGGYYIYPVYGDSNQIYIDRIEGGESVTVEVPMMTSDVTENVVSLVFYVSYSNGNGLWYENTIGLHVPIEVEGGLEVSNVNIGDKAILGGSTGISFSYRNMGNVTLTNVKLLINGNVEEKYKEISVGNIASGARGTSSHNIGFMESGQQEIEVKVSYEMGAGRTVELELGTYTVEVSTYSFDENGEGTGTGNITEALGETDPKTVMAMVAGAIGAILILKGITKLFSRHR